MDWSGVITCGLLWCFYQLFGLSFWRHPFTAEDPLLSKWCNATFLQIWWRNKLIYILTGLRVSTFHFLNDLTYFFKSSLNAWRNGIQRKKDHHQSSQAYSTKFTFLMWIMAKMKTWWTNFVQKYTGFPVDERKHKW